MSFIDQQIGFGIITPPISLKDRFIIPPFTIFDARQGDWQNRKKIWLSLNIKGEEGRNQKLLGSRLGYEVMEKNDGSMRKQQGTSIFDPVLCEITYRWFCPPNGKILDPFAGGSVRGIVASILDVNYTGIELRKEQVKANYPQWEGIKKRQFANNKPDPKWIQGNSIYIQDLISDQFDLIFTCPPYWNLEKYSDDPEDISNMSWEDFLEAYFKIIRNSCKKLRNNRFAVIVISDFRDNQGLYKMFPSYTIKAFKEAGLHLYNEAVLVTAIGSLPIRAGRQFKISRKLGKAHQNYLVFYKGNPKNIKKNFPEEI